MVMGSVAQRILPTNSTLLAKAGRSMLLTAHEADDGMANHPLRFGYSTAGWTWSARTNTADMVRQSRQHGVAVTNI